MTDIVERLRQAPWEGCENDAQIITLTADAAGEITRLRLRLADLEVSIAAFRQTVKDWEF